MIFPASPCQLSDVVVKAPQQQFLNTVNVVEHSDRIQALKYQEDTKYHYGIYTGRFKSSCSEKLPDSPEATFVTFDQELRGKICAWNFKVVDHCNFPRELAERSISFFDRCLATRGNFCPTDEMAWLMGMVALHLTIKIHHTTPMGVDFLVALSRDQFNKDQIVAMESYIIRTLLWNLNPPTATEFLYSYISLLPAEVSPLLKNEIYEWSKFAIHASISDAFFVPFRPSNIAFAAIMNVMEDMKLLQENSTLASFFKDELGANLLCLVNGSEDFTKVRMLKTKLRRIMWENPEYIPPAAIDMLSK